jgi:hypothetical protein
MILNYYFDDFLTLFLKTLEYLDAFNILHAQKQFAECSSTELNKTENSSETITISMSKDEVQKQIDESTDKAVIKAFVVGFCLGSLLPVFIHYLFLN